MKSLENGSFVRTTSAFSPRINGTNTQRCDDFVEYGSRRKP
ncbi:hypothetical protein ALP94_01340 [Pseudomonas savastanoi pv. glycinea]|nr:hypothetical protein ALP94_01340 [Pseudomonas savastanoi pv. glycinea]